MKESFQQSFDFIFIIEWKLKTQDNYRMNIKETSDSSNFYIIFLQAFHKPIWEVVSHEQQQESFPSVVNRQITIQPWIHYAFGTPFFIYHLYIALCFCPFVINDIRESKT